jgi:hypothetical protein
MGQQSMYHSPRRPWMGLMHQSTSRHRAADILSNATVLLARNV